MSTEDHVHKRVRPNSPTHGSLSVQRTLNDKADGTSAPRLPLVPLSDYEPRNYYSMPTSSTTAADFAFDDLKKSADRLVEEHEAARKSIESYARDLSNSQALVSKLSSELTRERNEKVKLESKIKHDQAEHQSIRDMMHVLQALQEQLKADVHRAEEEITNFEDQKENMEKAFDKRLALSNDVSEKVTRLDEENKKLKFQLNELAENEASLKREMAMAVHDAEEVKCKLDVSQQILESERVEQHKKSSALASEMERALSELDAANSKLRETEALLVETQSDKKSCVETSEALKHELEIAVMKHSTDEVAIRSLQTAADEIIAQKLQLEQDLTAMKKRSDELNNEIGEIKAALNSRDEEIMAKDAMTEEIRAQLREAIADEKNTEMIIQLQKEKTAMDAACNELNGQLREKDSKIADLSDKVVEMEETTLKLSAELQTAEERLRNELAEKEAEIEEVKASARKKMRDYADKAQKELAEMRENKQRNLSDWSADMNTELQRTIAEKKVADSKISELNSLTESLKKTLKQVQKEKENISKELRTLQEQAKQFDTTRDKKSKTTQEIEKLKEKCKQEQERSVALEKRLEEKFNRELNKNEAALITAQTRCQELEMQLHQLRQQLQKAEAQHSACNATVIELKEDEPIALTPAEEKKQSIDPKSRHKTTVQQSVADRQTLIEVPIALESQAASPSSLNNMSDTSSGKNAANEVTTDNIIRRPTRNRRIQRMLDDAKAYESRLSCQSNNPPRYRHNGSCY